jgi:hypothetical protein
MDLLPTPRANEVNGLNLENNPKLAERNKSNLEEVIAKSLLPTPTATSDAKGGCTRKEEERQNDTLAHSIHGIVGEAGKTSQLNPLFVAEMMSFPTDWTELPFLSGEPKVSKHTETQ